MKFKKILYLLVMTFLVFSLAPAVLAEETDITENDLATVQALTDSQISSKILSLKSKYPEGMKWDNNNTYKTIASNAKDGTSRGCQAFAWLVQDVVYGNSPYIQHNDYSSIKPGDFIRINNDTHAVIVISRTGNKIEVVEGNYSGKIHWGRVFDLNNLNINYVISRDTKTVNEVTTIKLNKTTLNLVVGATSPLVATVNPSGTKVTWSSSNTSVATVASTGLVTAKKAGTAVIKVTTADNKVSASCTVTVTNAQPSVVSVSGVSISSTSKTVSVGDSYTITTTVKPSNATNKAYTWSSSNTSVATVTSTGKVTAKKAGTATLTVKTSDGNKTASHKVTVNATTKSVKVTGVSVSPTSKTLAVGETLTLTATVKPTNATNKDVSWSSSNTSVATVTSTGKVTAKKAGTATITVKTKDGSKTATSKITVTSKTSTVKVTGVSVSPTTKTLAVGETLTLTATVKPTNATNKNVSWSTSSSSVATVTSTGKVTAKKAGTATITVKTKDGSKTATSKITVTNSSSNSSQTLKAGDTVTFGSYGGSTLVKDSALIKKLEAAKVDQYNNITLNGTKYHRLSTGYGGIYEYYAFEPLRWKVLNSDNNGYLLITESVIGEGTFKNYKSFANTEFYNTAFDSSMKKDLLSNGIKVSYTKPTTKETTTYFDGTEKIRPLTEEELGKYLNKNDLIAKTLPSMFAYNGNKAHSYWLGTVNLDGVQKGYIRDVSAAGKLEQWTGGSGNRGYRPVIKVSKSSKNLTKVK